MRRTEITRRLEQAEHDARRLTCEAPRLLEAFDRFASGGFAPRGDTGIGGSRGCHSPVEAALMAPDAALTARQRYERLLLTLTNTLTDLNAVHREWLTASRDGAGRPQPGCVIMFRVGVWEPATLTNANGNLGGRILLGRWAREFTIRHGRLPTDSEAERRAQGADVRVAS